MIIGIDVDLTIVNPSSCGNRKSWFWWLMVNSYNDPTERILKDLDNNCCEYNLSKYFDLKPKVDPMDFWRAENLYDNMEPYADAVEVINRLCEDHEVVFVSMCKGHHHKSKYRMLDKYFPAMSGFVATKEKRYVRTDAFVDDRHEFLNQLNTKLPFKMETPYTQSQQLIRPVIPVKDWYEIESALVQQVNKI